MVVRLRQTLVLVLATLFGYSLGNGPVADWVVDLSNLVGMLWNVERAARGPSGTIPLLIAGFLLGQGVFLFARQMASTIGPLHARRIESLAAWDAAMQLPTRFGLHRYLQECTAWAAEDPVARTQTLALFKVQGLGALNDRHGTLVTTQLLKRIATELRSAALPDGTSRVRRWLTHHVPQPFALTTWRSPVSRYPARWSGATFALAFRDLDGVRAISIARDFAGWIRSELSALATATEPSLVVAIALGTAGVTGRQLATAATSTLAEATAEAVTVLIDPLDVQCTAIEQMSGVRTKKVSILKTDAETTEAHAVVSESHQGRTTWLRSWGPSTGCLAAALVVLWLTGSRSPMAATFPWPQSLTEVQVLDRSGPRTVRLARTSLGEAATPSWKLTDVLVVQGRPSDGFFGVCQVHVRITNTSHHTFYISPFDFRAVDTGGKLWSFDPLRALRMTTGLKGFWLHPGKTWSGWLELFRGEDPIVGLVFEPDRFTRLVVTTTP